MRSSTLFPASVPASAGRARVSRRPSPARRLGALWSGARDSIVRWRRKRETRLTLDRLDTHALRDIGLVRYVDAGTTRYDRLPDWE